MGSGDSVGLRVGVDGTDCGWERGKPGARDAGPSLGERALLAGEEERLIGGLSRAGVAERTIGDARLLVPLAVLRMGVALVFTFARGRIGCVVAGDEL